MGRVLFYKNLFWQILLQGAKYVFPLLLLPYLTRILRPDGYAVYAYVISYGTLVQVFVEYGFNLSGTRFIAQAKDKDEQGRITGDIFISRLFLSVISMLATFFIAQYIPVLRENIIFVLSVVLAADVKASMPDFIFQGYERLGSLTGRFIFSKTLSVFPVFFLVNSIDDLCWIPFLDLVSGILALIWSYYLAEKLFSVGFKVSGFYKALCLLKTNFSYFISNMSAASLSGLTTLIIGVSSLKFVEVSYWSIALTAVGAIQSLFGPLLNSLYPHIVIHNDIGFVEKIVKLSVPVMTILCAVFVFSSDIIVRVIAGVAYLDGVWVMQWLSVLIFFSFFSMLFGWPLLGARGYAEEVATTTVLSSLVCLLSLIAVEATFGLSMELLCIIRCASEFVLLVTRFRYCLTYKLLFSSRVVINNT